MLDSVVEDERSPRKSTSIDVACRGISVDEKGPTTVESGKDHLAMVDNMYNDNCEGRSTASDRPKEIFLKEKTEIDTALGEDENKPSNAESSSQSKGKKKKKKKASKGTESPQNNTDRKETKNEDQTSSEGIKY